MINARASIFNFINGQMAAMSSIMTPAIRAELVTEGKSYSFPNCLNVQFQHDPSRMRSNPTWRDLSCMLHLFVEIDPTKPEVAESQAYAAIHEINKFMIAQAVEKKNYSVNPAVSLGSKITWVWPLNWRSGTLKNERYIHKTCFLVFRYFEERIP